MTACDSCCQGCHPISSWWFRHFGDRWNRHNLSRIRCRGRRKQLPVECTPSILFSLKGEIAWREAAPCCFVESFDLHFLVGMTGSGKTASFLLPMLERLCLDSQITDTAWQQRFKLCRPAIWVLSCLIYHWYILRYLYTRIFILLEIFLAELLEELKKSLFWSLMWSDVVYSLRLWGQSSSVRARRRDAAGRLILGSKLWHNDTTYKTTKRQHQKMEMAKPHRGFTDIHRYS